MRFMAVLLLAAAASALPVLDNCAKDNCSPEARDNCAKDNCGPDVRDNCAKEGRDNCDVDVRGGCGCGGSRDDDAPKKLVHLEPRRGFPGKKHHPYVHRKAFNSAKPVEDKRPPKPVFPFPEYAPTSWFPKHRVIYRPEPDVRSLEGRDPEGSVDDEEEPRGLTFEAAPESDEGSEDLEFCSSFSLDGADWANPHQIKCRPPPPYWEERERRDPDKSWKDLGKELQDKGIEELQELADKW